MFLSLRDFFVWYFSLFLMFKTLFYRNLTSDKSFHSLILKLKDEPVPYFFQYSEVRSITLL